MFYDQSAYPLRFEWGFPLAPLSYEESYVFEFTIGNFF